MHTMYNALARAAKKGPGQFHEAYFENAQKIYAITAQPFLLTSDIQAVDTQEAANIIRFSCIFNDVSFASFMGGKSFILRLETPESMKGVFGVDHVRITASQGMIQKYRLSESSVSLGSLMPDDAEIATFLREVHPLIGSGRLIVRPTRLVFLIKEGNPLPITGLQVNPNNPFGDWSILDDPIESKPMPICFTTGNYDQESELFNICVPFIEGIPFDKLNKIITEEYGHIADLRAALKKTIEQATKDHVSTTELVRDVLEPKLYALERRLEKICRMRSIMAAGAALSMISASLVTGSVTGLVNAVIDAGAIGIAAKELASYIGERAELKEDPLYFLWRCSRVERR